MKLVTLFQMVFVFVASGVDEGRREVGRTG